MARQIIAIHFSASSHGRSRKHARHISRVKWLRDGAGIPRERRVSQVIRRIRAGKRYYVVGTDGVRVEVEIARRKLREYIHTKRDGDECDNLLALPKF